MYLCIRAECFLKGVIILKRYLRIFAGIMVVIMSVLAFAGCGDDKNSNQAGQQSGNYQMIISSVNQINCDYLLVYHEGVGYNELNSYIDFLEALSTASTETFQICPDTLNITDADQKLILLGATRYGESTQSAQLMSDIRSNNYYDYLLRGYKNTLTVNWMSKFGREDAFKYVLNSLLTNGFDSAFKSDYSHLYLSDRTDTPVVTIDDINIVQYSVVMSGSPSYIERNAAERLVDAIEDATGVVIPLVTDAVEESQYEILVGDTNRGETYVTQFFATKRYSVAQYNTKLILRGGQIEATSKAVSDFVDMVTNTVITAEPLHIKANYCLNGSIDTYGGDYFDGYELIFSDEFNSGDIDTEKWTLEDGAITTYGDSAGLMFFKPGSVRSDNHAMSIRTYLSFDGHVSGHVTSEDSFSFKYGYAEVRAKFRSAPGVWLKLMLTNQNDGKDLVSQIDVFNCLTSNDTIFASAGVLESKSYYSNYLKLNEPSFEALRSGTLEYGKLLNDEEYHTYGVEWTPTHITYYIDGKSYGTVEISAQKYKDLNTEMYLDFIAGVNLTEEVAVDEVAMWPLDFTVDWVRVYQKSGGTFTDRTLIADAPAATPDKK